MSKMKRELWAIGQTFSNGVLVLNSLFCDNKDTDEGEASNEEMEQVIQMVRNKCSDMMIEDAVDVLIKASELKRE